MTENEAINEIIKEVCSGCYGSDEEPHRCSTCGFRMAKDALEEIQQYRAIGTVEGYKRAIETSKENYLLYAEYKAKVQAFEAIGTIEEFKALKKEVELYRNLDKTNFSDGYNKAIDEFAEKIALEISESIIWGILVDSDMDNSFSDTSDRIVDYVIDNVKRIAEQMKGGATDAE